MPNPAEPSAAPPPATPLADTARRAGWMGLLARAEALELTALVEAAPALPAFTRLRGPETGLVMLRGRAGGSGAPFNLGEMTATRASVRDAAGWVGHATISGRNEAHALLAARLDAALQDPAREAALHAAVLAPLARAEAARREALARHAAATKVDFFALTVQRGQR